MPVQHSPLPWRLGTHSTTLIQDINGDTVGGTSGDNSQSKSDAAYIVEAVNRYEPKAFLLPTEFAPVDDITGDAKNNRRYTRMSDILDGTTALSNGFTAEPADSTPRYLVVETTPDCSAFFAYQCDTLQDAITNFQDSETEDLNGAIVHDLDTDEHYDLLWERRVHSMIGPKGESIPFIHAVGR